MEKKLKGLWIGDAVAGTGFARVNHSIIENLPEDEYEIHHLGVNYTGDPHPYKHFIYPATVGMSGFVDVYGITRLDTLINGIQPDFIFILNDAWIIDMYLARLKEIRKANIPIITYFPVDAEEHSVVWYNNFDVVRAACTYTEFGRSILKKVNSPHIYNNKIHIVPHGTDINKFYPVDWEEARYKIYPKNRTEEFMKSFIILNANRNQPRKRIDITLWAFDEFQKDKDDVKLYLHMGASDEGVNIVEKALQYGWDRKLVVTTLESSIPNVPTEFLNLIYNGTDVGINTSMGEGWGLVNWEHASCKRVQILPRHSSIPEIWQDKAILIDANIKQMFPYANTVGRVPLVDDVVDALNYAYWDWKDNESRISNDLAQKAYDMVTSEEYSWKTVAKKFDEIIKSVI